MAAAIIAAGPEPLQSQFATGYNMAANLLRTRSLDEARAFIERSFGNYLGEYHAASQLHWSECSSVTALALICMSARLR